MTDFRACPSCGGFADPARHCDACGEHLPLGAYPFCPHGRYAGGIQPDTFNASGMWVENLSSDGTPTWVEGRSDLQRKAAAQGLRWVPEGLTTSKVRKLDDDMRGRYNGGALPTFREHHAPDTTGALSPAEQHKAQQADLATAREVRDPATGRVNALSVRRRA